MKNAHIVYSTKKTECLQIKLKRKRFLSAFAPNKKMCQNSLAQAVMAVYTRLVLIAGVNVRLIFGRENLIGKFFRQKLIMPVFSNLLFQFGYQPHCFPHERW